jgi:hypothetical protein
VKVKIEFTLDVNPDAWSSNYGVTGAAKIREDVRRYVESDVTDFFRSHGFLKEDAACHD